jgi:2-phospho-L-lactate guanylyltransferase
LTFGDDSFFPHLKTAKTFGIDPLVVRLPGIGRDIDNQEDLRAFARFATATRTQAYLDRHQFSDWRRASSAQDQEATRR